MLLENGEDFAGSMMFARRSLGMAFCYAERLDSDNLMGNDVESSLTVPTRFPSPVLRTCSSRCQGPQSLAPEGPNN